MSIVKYILRNMQWYSLSAQNWLANLENCNMTLLWSALRRSTYKKAIAFYWYPLAEHTLHPHNTHLFSHTQTYTALLLSHTRKSKQRSTFFTMCELDVHTASYFLRASAACLPISSSEIKTETPSTFYYEWMIFHIIKSNHPFLLFYMNYMLHNPSPFPEKGIQMANQESNANLQTFLRKLENST